VIVVFGLVLQPPTAGCSAALVPGGDAGTGRDSSITDAGPESDACPSPTEDGGVCWTERLGCDLVCRVEPTETECRYAAPRWDEATVSELWLYRGSRSRETLAEVDSVAACDERSFVREEEAGATSLTLCPETCARLADAECLGYLVAVALCI
jgi:hypothetical protein